MASTQYVLGIDFGTDSVRTVMVDVADGAEIASGIFYYPRWKKGSYCDPSKNQFRQHPLDYVEGLEKTIREVVRKAGNKKSLEIRAIGIDTTGSTPVAVDTEGTPLALKKEFAGNPNAMFVLWKDHTAVGEAGEINHLARTWGGTDFTKYEGGVYSSEWFWAKILHVLREDKQVRNQAFSWVEHCDWIPGLLTGNTRPGSLLRSRCAAGHKAMWHAEWNGLPDEQFLIRLDPLLSGLRDRLYSNTYTADIPAGKLAKSWSAKLGLPEGVTVATGTFDAHSGALGGEVSGNTLIKVMGTSTCDMLVAPLGAGGEKLVAGICGQVDGSIVPGMLGLEAGQSAFGDVYAWFTRLLEWPLDQLIAKSRLLDKEIKEKLIRDSQKSLMTHLTREAGKIPAGESGIVALDWLNGRRTPYANQNLKGLISGLNLGSDAPRIFRALVEATCFGSRKIIERFREEGISIHKVIALGGVAKKSPFVMQVMADVLNMPIKVARSEQAPALGAAMLAATAAGIFKKTEDAQHVMGNGFDMEFKPEPVNVKRYQALYEKYNLLGSVVEKNSL